MIFISFGASAGYNKKFSEMECKLIYEHAIWLKNKEINSKDSQAMDDWTNRLATQATIYIKLFAKNRI
tara:strand:- start:56 stop:259 length:204 start_codon:yes stop_codon:yes gene_type:complete